MSNLKVDLELIQKYNVPGPRYTSYPPAPQFTDRVTWPEVAAKISEAQSPERGLSLYFHIPFCESLCWYCGCTTVITTQREKGALFLSGGSCSGAGLVPLFPHSVLRVALLVLRMHHRHHDAAGKRSDLPQIP